MSNDARAQAPSVRLGPAAAGSCRRRVHLDHVPIADRATRTALDPAAKLLLADIAQHRDVALAIAGAQVPEGALLARSLRSERRLAVIDLLIPDGQGYVPILIRGHRTLDAGTGAPVSVLADPLARWSSMDYKQRPHQADALALAHCYRLLQDLGMAATRAIGGIIGRGNVEPELICWHDLDGPAPSTLADYDVRIADRFAVADAAAQQAPPLAWPSRVAECRRCPWDSLCSAELAARRDISLIAPGADAVNLRSAGLLTVDDLAAATDEQLAVVAANGLTGSRTSEGRIKARAWQRGKLLARRREVVQVPRADIELDVDMESYVEDGAYLWGTYLTGTGPGLTAVSAQGGEPGYRGFVTWDPLPAQAEGEAFVEFWAYLQGLREIAVGGGLTFAAYCYSRSAEDRWLLSTPVRYPQVPGMPTVAQIREFIGSLQWVDIYEVVGREFMVSGSRRLKTVAPVAGFSWRDPEPGGANSMVWYRGAVGADGRPPDDALKVRVLEYNEDDVLATLALRNWMTDRAADDTPTVAELELLTPLQVSGPR